MKSKENKWINLFVVQGNYGYGWNDLTSTPSYMVAKKDIKDYRMNERALHRIIRRRVLNPKYKK